MLILIVSIFFSIKISKNLTKPLIELNKAAHEIDTNSIYSAKIPILGTTETKELGEVIDNMIKIIRNSILDKEKALLNVSRNNKKLMEEIINRKQTERELVKAKEKAEESNKLKSEFLTIMTHELKTPLNSIIGYSRMLVNKFDYEKFESDSKFLKKIESNGYSLLKIVNDILELTKLESGDIELSINEINIDFVINNIINQNEEQISKKLINVSYENNSGITNISSDYSKVEQIFYKIISNSIKFTEKGSVSINILKENSNIIIFIKDTGIGIKKDQINKIFNLFTQVDGSVSRKFEGTGLGLTIAQKYSILLNGKIEVASTENVGSTFKITLPIKFK